MGQSAEQTARQGQTEERQTTGSAVQFNYFSIFLTFGFWGGPMAGENVQFEESQDKNCVKNLER